MESFWEGFEKQSGWKKNLVIGAGALGGAGYGLKRLGDKRTADLHKNIKAIPKNDPRWARVKKKHLLNDKGADDLSRHEAYMDYQEAKQI